MWTPQLANVPPCYLFLIKLIVGKLGACVVGAGVGFGVGADVEACVGRSAVGACVVGCTVGACVVG